MEMNLKEGIYFDDPHNKIMTEQESIQVFADAYNYLGVSIAKLKELITSPVMDDSTRQNLKQSLDILKVELQKLNDYAGQYVKKLNPSKVQDVDKLMSVFNRGGAVGINESTQDKINKTIKRIIEVNKKINHGNQFK